jgi:hypothetical protein
MVSGARSQIVQWLTEPEGRKYNGSRSQKAESTMVSGEEGGSTMVSGARKQKVQWLSEQESRKYNG